MPHVQLFKVLCIKILEPTQTYGEVGISCRGGTILRKIARVQKLEAQILPQLGLPYFVQAID